MSTPWLRLEFLSRTVAFTACADLRCVRRTALHPRDRDEGQPQIAHGSEQTKERSLINHRTGQRGGAVLFVAEAQPGEPRRSAFIQVSLEANLVVSGRVSSLGGVKPYHHFFTSFGWRCRGGTFRSACVFLSSTKP